MRAKAAGANDRLFDPGPVLAARHREGLEWGHDFLLIFLGDTAAKGRLGPLREGQVWRSAANDRLWRNSDLQPRVGNVCFQELAKLASTADIGRIAAVRS
jgi:hypothetical protein